MAYIVPGSLVVTPQSPTDRDGLTFTFQAKMEYFDTLLGWAFNTSFHVQYQLTTAGALQWTDLTTVASGVVWEDSVYLSIVNPAMVTITVPNPGIVPGKYNFIVVDDGDYKKLPPYTASRIAEAQNVNITHYTAPIQSPVTITINPTPSNAAVTIDGLSTLTTTVPVGTTVHVVAELYGYTVYDTHITASTSYVGSTMYDYPVLSPCGVSDPNCFGYTPVTTTTGDTTTTTCGSSDYVCQLTPYAPYIIAGAIVLLFMMNQPRPSGGGYRPQPSSPAVIVERS